MEKNILLEIIKCIYKFTNSQNTVHDHLVLRFYQELRIYGIKL